MGQTGLAGQNHLKMASGSYDMGILRELSRMEEEALQEIVRYINGGPALVLMKTTHLLEAIMFLMQGGTSQTHQHEMLSKQQNLV